MKKLFTIALFSIVAFCANAQIVITEIMYNNPGTDDYEYIEIYNHGPVPVNLEGYSFSKGVTYVFPNISINPADYLVIAKDSIAMTTGFGVVAYNWFSGSLNNSGEEIELIDAGGTVVDYVDYDESGDWPSFADGHGTSLSLCDKDADNNVGTNWESSTNPTIFAVGSQIVYADPGQAYLCSGIPLVNINMTDISVNEMVGVIEIPVDIQNPNADATSFELLLVSTSTADASDYTLLTPTVTFPAGTDTSQVIRIAITDDMDLESNEFINFDVYNATNSIILLDIELSIEIIDNDAPLDNGLIVTGVYDAQNGSALVKGIELYAVSNIADLSIYGVGSANNGGGSDGVEFTFPGGTSLAAGDFIYVADDSTKFHDYFGFAPTYVNGASNINGDDAIEVFENAMVIDVFGDINVDGTGEPWEYLDGWAYRNNGTGPDGSTFVLGNWTFGGIDALDGSPDNAGATTPFPIGTYSPMMPTNYEAKNDTYSTNANEAVNMDILSNDITPNAISTITIASPPANGMIDINSDNTLTYTPNQDYCGADMFTYEACDAGGCDQATVTLDVICPSNYVSSNIGAVTMNNTDGISNALGTTVELEGLVYGVNINAGGLSFVLIDENNDGITVYNEDMDLGYTVNEGDQVVVQGTIDQYNGLTEIIADNVTIVMTSLTQVSPTLVTVLDESTESQLVTIENLYFVDITQWGNGNSGFNMDMTDGGSNTYTVRIDDDVDLFAMGAPDENSIYRVTGLGGQFDFDVPYDDGYQLLPRYFSDIEQGLSVQNPDLGNQVKLFPNPVNQNLVVVSEIDLDDIQIHNLLGQRLLQVTQPSDKEVLNLSSFENGFYIITFRSGNDTWTEQLIKQ